MASLSLSPHHSPALSRSVCHMFGYSPPLAILVNVIRAINFLALEARLSQLEERLHSGNFRLCVAVQGTGTAVISSCRHMVRQWEHLICFGLEHVLFFLRAEHAVSKLPDCVHLIEGSQNYDHDHNWINCAALLDMLSICCLAEQLSVSIISLLLQLPCYTIQSEPNPETFWPMGCSNVPYMTGACYWAEHMSAAELNVSCLLHWSQQDHREQK